MLGPEANARSSMIGDVRAYWEALRNGRPVPLRSEVEPRGLERALECAFILERVAPRVARFRLAGSHLNDLMGMEVRGMPLSSFFAPSFRGNIADVLEDVFQGPNLAEIGLSAESGIGRPPLAGRMILLPLRSDLGDVTRALGCLVTDGQLGRSPRRFEVLRRQMTNVSDGLTGPEVPEAAPVTGFSERAARYIPASRAGRPAHLRLVKSDGADT